MVATIHWHFITCPRNAFQDIKLPELLGEKILGDCTDLSDDGFVPFPEL